MKGRPREVAEVQLLGDDEIDARTTALTCSSKRRAAPGKKGHSAIATAFPRLRVMGKPLNPHSRAHPCEQRTPTAPTAPHAEAISKRTVQHMRDLPRAGLGSRYCKNPPL